MSIIFNKLRMIQTSLKAPKDKRNSFGGYTYRSCEGILEALKPLLKETQTALTMSDSIEVIGDRIYVKAVATLTDTEKGEQISTTAYRREAETKKGNDESQITGSASSYRRKYRLNGLFAIDDSKDADTDEYRQMQAEKPKPKPTKAKADGTTDIPLQWQNRVCEICGKELSPKVAERSHEVFKGHMYCSKECRQKGSVEGIQADIENKLKGKTK